MSFPAPNVVYRIQSVDFRTYLELWDTEEDPVILRAREETDLQQWLFVKDASSSSERYKIMAAATQSLPDPVYLTAPKADDSGVLQLFPETPLIGIPDDCGPSLWRICKNKDGTYGLATKDQDAHHELFLKVTTTGMLDCIGRRTSARQAFDRSIRWQIIESYPSLSKDTYQITTFNGKALTMATDLTQLTVETAEADTHQEWRVEPKGNGKCIISLNTEEEVYLGWERGRDGIAKVTTSKIPVEWFVDHSSEIFYSISLEYVVDKKTTLALALSVIDEDVLLQPKKVSRSQIWFFDSVNMLSSSERPPPYSITERFPEIPENTNRRIRNLGNNMYISFDASSVWTIGASNSISYYPSITYIGGSNTFKLHYSSIYGRASGNTVDIVQNENEGTAWVLERRNDPAGGYIYYICPSFNRTQAISGESVPGSGGTQTLSMARKKYSNRYQQWKIEA